MQPHERIPTVGLDAGGGGICILLQTPVKEAAAAELTIGAMIENQPLTMIGRVCWGDVVKVKGSDHYRYGLKLESIADEDWDRLMQWSVETNSEYREGEPLSEPQRDALLISQTQEEIARELLARERIDPFGENRLPPIEYHFRKYTMRQGVPYVWLLVRSRCSDRINHTVVDHMTNILVGCYDRNIKILD